MMTRRKFVQVVFSLLCGGFLFRQTPRAAVGFDVGRGVVATAIFAHKFKVGDIVRHRFVDHYRRFPMVVTHASGSQITCSYLDHELSSSIPMHMADDETNFETAECDQETAEALRKLSKRIVFFGEDEIIGLPTKGDS